MKILPRMIYIVFEFLVAKYKNAESRSKKNVFMEQLSLILEYGLKQICNCSFTSQKVLHQNVLSWRAMLLSNTIEKANFELPPDIYSYWVDYQFYLQTLSSIRNFNVMTFHNKTIFLMMRLMNKR